MTLGQILDQMQRSMPADLRESYSADADSQLQVQYSTCTAHDIPVLEDILEDIQSAVTPTCHAASASHSIRAEFTARATAQYSSSSIRVILL